MAAYQVAPPERFNFSRPDEWPKWISRFERFRCASGLNEKGEEAQVHTLVYSMGDEADDILSSFRLTEQNRKKYEIVKEKFNTHFVKRRNTIFERAKFKQRRQEEGESADSFIMDLYRLAEHCGYEGLHDEMVRDRIVVGLRNAALSEKLQMDPDLTLEKAVTSARQTEEIKKQQTIVRGDLRESRVEHEVGYVQKGKEQFHKPSSSRWKPTKGNLTPPGVPKQTSGFPKPKACTRCGRSPAHGKQYCPARESICHRCGKTGHFKAMCRSADSVSFVHTEERDETEAFLGAVWDTEHHNPWITSLLVNGKPVEFKIDTGADVTVMPKRVFDSLPGDTLKPAKKILCGPSRRTLPVKGQFVATLKSNEERQKRRCSW